MDTTKPDVAFLGPPASYTHQATRTRFSEDKYELAPMHSIEDVFAAVQSKSAIKGVVPFENSSNGSVVFTLDLFADIHERYPDIIVCSEAYLAVRHCLVGRRPSRNHKRERSLDMPWRRLTKEEDDSNSPTRSGQATPTQAHPEPPAPRAKPSYDLSHIKRLYSHPQAWGQCKAFLATYHKGVERVDVGSTSRAAEVVSQDETGTSAAISSRLAAEVNGLDLLAEGIEDNDGNQTRFLVIRHRGEDGGVGLGELQGEEGAAEGVEGWKSLVSFTLEHGEPGALMGCLAVFKEHGLNLTSINTRPSGEGPWHYVFFVEFFGRREESGGPVNEAVDGLAKVAKRSRWLGSWKNARKA